MPKETLGSSSELNGVVRMRDTVFFEGPEARQRIGRFWILLTLASVIATAGVVADSTATVIGAMIVAPMMLPIQGSMLAVVLGDRKNLIRRFGFMVAGARSWARRSSGTSTASVPSSWWG